MRELTEQERAEVERDAALPQLDARELVDEEYLERAIKEMYTEVAENPGGEFHFLTGRALAEGLGYDPSLLDRVPAEAVESFAGVGHYLDLADLREGECVVDLGSGSGTDLFCAAVLVGPTGRAIGVEMTAALLDKARRVRDA
ncbi:MAG TPA: methyltransferase domain-containing protein, partial [Miltoncostaeaceae bacterium]|nr:methyltransferase domain-containing protein [Miltoncostaeaceae bacterium]